MMNYTYLACKAFLDILICIMNLCPAQNPAITVSWGKAGPSPQPLGNLLEVTFPRALLKDKGWRAHLNVNY